MLADIGVGLSVKRTLLHARHEVGHESVAEPVALLHQGVKVARCRIERERARIAQAGRERAWFDPSASKRWIDALTSGSTPVLPDDPTPTNRAPVLGSIARWRLA